MKDIKIGSKNGYLEIINIVDDHHCMVKCHKCSNIFVFTNSFFKYKKSCGCLKKKIVCTIEGKETTVKEISEKLKVPIRNLYDFMRRNDCSLKETYNHYNSIIEKVDFERENSYYFSHSNANSIKKLCEELNVNYKYLLQYKKCHKCSLDEACFYYLNKDKITKERFKHHVGDGRYLTTKEMAKELDVTVNSIYRFINKNNASYEECYSHYSNHKKRKHYCILTNGKIASSLQEAADDIGVAISTLKWHMKKNNWNLQETYDFYKNEYTPKNKKTFEFEGSTYTLTEFSKVCNVKVSTLNSYVRKHPELSPKEIYEFYKNGVKNKKKSFLLKDGRVIESERKLAKELNIDTSTLRYFIKTHKELSIDEVYEHFKNKK